MRDRFADKDCTLDTSSLATYHLASSSDCIARIGFGNPAKLQACIEAMMLNGMP